MKDQFYEVYGPHYEEDIKGGTALIKRSKYKEIVQLLLSLPSYQGKKRPQSLQNYMKRYILGTIIEGLGRQWKEHRAKSSCT